MIHVEAEFRPARVDIERCWTALAGRPPENPFLSDVWLLPWFEQIAAHRSPVLVRIVDARPGSGDGLMAFGVLHRATIRRRGLFRRTQIYLNEYPLGDNQMVIEYNGLVCRPGCQGVAWQGLMRWLANSYAQWDECCFSAIEPDQTPAIAHAAASLGMVCLIDRCQRAPYGDLREPSWPAVEHANLSANRRRQIRRSLALYAERYGPVTIRVVDALDEFEPFWQAMGACHSRLWQARGYRGAFANPVWSEFNRAICRAGLANGTVQLLVITAGETPFGYLYNLVGGRQAFNIQSAFRYEHDNRLRPGFVCHYLAMQLCHAAGLQKYHYLAGGEDYKVSLSAREDWLSWLVVRRSREGFLVEDITVAVARLCKSAWRRLFGWTRAGAR